jgi:hypothetical protein
MMPSLTTLFGVVTLDGQKYLEQVQVFPLEITIASQNQVLTNQTYTLPGVAPFLLKGLSRVTISPRGNYSNVWTTDRLFRFKLFSQPGSTWFFSGGLGIFDDRVFDRLCFGSGQFPYMLIPPVPVNASGTLMYEVEDVAGFGTDPVLDYPYKIYIAMQGSYLLPANVKNGTLQS